MVIITIIMLFHARGTTIVYIDMNQTYTRVYYRMQLSNNESITYIHKSSKDGNFLTKIFLHNLFEMFE